MLTVAWRKKKNIGHNCSRFAFEFIQHPEADGNVFDNVRFLYRNKSF